MKPQEASDDFQHGDRKNIFSMKRSEDLRVQGAGEGGQVTEGYDNFQHGDNKNWCSREMEEHTCESRVQGKEVKPHETCDDFQHGDEKNSFSMKRAEDLLVQGAGEGGQAPGGCDFQHGDSWSSREMVEDQTI